jgi:hypothetical protein
MLIACITPIFCKEYGVYFLLYNNLINAELMLNPY